MSEQVTVGEVMETFKRVNKALTRIAKDRHLLLFATVECGEEVDQLLRRSADLLNAIVDKREGGRRLDA